MLKTAVQPDAPSKKARSQGFFFVVGQARSGTNWACSLLNLHPRIYCHGEYHFERLKAGFDDFTGRAHGLGALDASVREKAREAFREFVRSCLSAQSRTRPGASWLGDRTPRPLEPLLDGCPHILIIRDGRDQIVSRIHHILRLGGPPNEPHKSRLAPIVEAFNSDPDYFHKHPDRLCADPHWLASLASQWASRMTTDLAMADRMSAGEFDASALVVRYEKLHEDTESERRRLYRFLRLDPEEAAPLADDSHTTPGLSREDPRSLYRMGKVGDWKNYATDDFRRIVKEHAGTQLVEYGFAPDLAW